ncbi:hypothetical protein M3Y94_00630000 [Aphelenchoides besseyi]|nr:hypothetical protein M3Y94_00630000 [Aphelenchoides besseyi]
METRRESLNSPSEPTYTNGRFLYQFAHFDRTVTVLDTFNGNQTLLTAATETPVGQQLTLTDLLVWSPCQLVVLWTDESSVYIGQVQLNYVERSYTHECSQVHPLDEFVGSQEQIQLSAMDDGHVLVAAPRTDGTVLFFTYEVESALIEAIGSANGVGGSPCEFHFHKGRIFFFNSLTVEDCRRAYCYDIQAGETHRMDCGPLDGQADPSSDLENLRFARHYLTAANGSFFLLVRTRAEDEFANSFYGEEDDYTDDWDAQLDPKARLFHLDLGVGKWREVKLQSLLAMPKLMLHETWDMVHFEPTNGGVLTIHSRLGSQFSDDCGMRCDHYSEHLQLQSSRCPMSVPESLTNLCWFTLAHTTGMEIMVPRNLPTRPLFRDHLALNNIEFRDEEAKAIVRSKQ